MTTHSTPAQRKTRSRRRNLVPIIGSVCRRSMARAMVPSRSTSAVYLPGTYVPAITQRSVPFARRTTGEHPMPGSSPQWTPDHRRDDHPARSCTVAPPTAHRIKRSHLPRPLEQSPSTLPLPHGHVPSPSSSDINSNDRDCQRESAFTNPVERITGRIRAPHSRRIPQATWAHRLGYGCLHYRRAPGGI